MSTEGAVTLSMTLSEWEALSGAVRVLERGGKRLEVTIPAGTKPGQTIRLRNALRVTDGREGDILIAVRVSTSQGQGGVMVVTDATFESEVLKSQLPVVVDFWAGLSHPSPRSYPWNLQTESSSAKSTSMRIGWLLSDTRS